MEREEREIMYRERQSEREKRREYIRRKRDRYYKEGK
jgi:hypothetical protein